MFLIIEEEKHVREYLEKRQLLAQYKKAKQFILEGFSSQTSLKLLQPKEKGVWSFRINKQFRALAVYKEETKSLIVFSISNHQDL